MKLTRILVLIAVLTALVVTLPAQARPSKSLLGRDKNNRDVSSETEFNENKHLIRRKGNFRKPNFLRQARSTAKSRLRWGKRALVGTRAEGSRLNSRPYPKVRTNFRRGSQLRNGRSLAAGRLRRKGRFFRGSRNYAVSPVGTSSYVKSALNEFLHDKSVGALLVLNDPTSGRTWRLMNGSNTVLKQVSPTEYAVRVNYFGQTGPGAPMSPVVLEFAISGKGTRWGVQDVRWVAVNGEARPGSFAINDEDLGVQDEATALMGDEAEVEVAEAEETDLDELAADSEDEQKVFPVKQL